MAVLRAAFRKKLSSVHTQRDADPANVVDGDVRLGSLHCANERAMNLRPISKFLLANALPLAFGANMLGEYLAERGWWSGWHAREVAR